MRTVTLDELTPGVLDSLIDEGVRCQILMGDRPAMALVSLSDFKRLEQLDGTAADRERAYRRGSKWEPWEDELMLDDRLDNLDIAIRTQRTVKSVHEHRRWIKKIAEAAKSGGDA